MSQQTRQMVQSQQQPPAEREINTSRWIGFPLGDKFWEIESMNDNNIFLF